MLNAILHHVGMSLIIFSKNEMLYEIEENNHPDWFNKGPCYNTTICSKLHGKVFENFIKNARTGRYNIMCSMIALDKQQPTHVENESSGVGLPAPKNSTKEALEALGATLNYIDFWLKMFHQNDEEIYMMYHEAIKEFSSKTQQ